ncbi:MAG: hypothetical protein M9921_07860 [Fimbriimonadaceae bacterium]|nr:zinc ribbon domain-containing protein [Chthonomonadaceae bacterium]MCO5296757.1 hypothetical protein [Fimbriimonadaceae bacterium]
MKCTRCGSNLNAGAPFCVQCGTMAGGPRTAMGPSAAMAMPAPYVGGPVGVRTGRRGGAVAAIWIVGALALVFAAGAGLQSAGLLQPLGNAGLGVAPANRPVAPSMTQTGASGGDALSAAGAALPDGPLRLAAGTDPSDLLQTEGGGSVPPVFEAQGASGPPMLQAQGSGGPPMLSQDQPGMPETIRNYLEHVRRCENQRMQMAASQVAEAVGMLTDLQSGANLQGLFDEDGPQVENTPPPTRRVTDRAGAMRGTWESLVRTFNSVQPPAECAAIRSYYDQVIRETAIMISEITNAVNQAANDRQRALQALMSLQGRSSSRIDRPARETDALVQSLCDKYQTRKWFDITADVGGGLLSKGF